ncbi:MAG: hypothetical protein A2X47_07800 [Lentisphaerae bacterium GWF2_38_69]|nr:MAG: hypothetical protein A2X47_07800 [Lentisphaerae bacterium GWF2_38_69]
MNKRIKQLASLSCFVFAVSAFADTPSTATAAPANVQNQVQPAGEQMEMPKTPEVDPKTWDFIPEVVATIGDSKITKDELVRILNPQVKMMLMMGQKPEEKQYKDLAANMAGELVKARILESMAAEAGYKVTPELENEVYNKFIENMKKQMPPGSDKDFNFEDIVKQQGFTLAEVKKQMAEGQAIQNFVEAKIMPSVTITDTDVKDFYNANKDKYFKKPETITASHILIRPKDDTEASWTAAKTQAEEIYKELQNGANFEQLADKYNEGPKNGGQLGSFAKGQMVPEFEAAAWKLANNGMKGYELVKTQFGWHIIKVTGFDKGGFIPLDDKLTEQIKQKLQQDGVFKKVNELIDEQMKKVNPVINLK